MSARGTMESRLDNAERKIEELTRRLANVNVREAKPPAYHDDDQIPFRNDSGETAPAYAVMEITGVLSAGGKTVKITKPTGARKRTFLVNGPSDVASGAFGWGRMHSPTAYALYDESATPAYGELWGPTTTWKLANTQSGFEVVGGVTGIAGAMRTLVKQLSPGNSYFVATGTGTASLTTLQTNAPVTTIDCQPTIATVAGGVVTNIAAGLYLVIRQADVICTGAAAGQNGGVVSGGLAAVGRPWTTYGTGGGASVTLSAIGEIASGGTLQVCGYQQSGADACTIGNALIAAVRIG